MNLSKILIGRRFHMSFEALYWIMFEIWRQAQKGTPDQAATYQLVKSTKYLWVITAEYIEWAPKVTETWPYMVKHEFHQRCKAQITI